MKNYVLHLTGRKGYIPYKGKYFRPTNEYNSYDLTLFNHFNDGLDQNESVWGLKASEFDNFGLLAGLHNIDITVDDIEEE